MVSKIQFLAVILVLVIPISCTTVPVAIVPDQDAGVRTLDWILIKGIEPKSENFGHYWIEIYGDDGEVIESYGWYPSDLDWDLTPWDDSAVNAIGGVRGEVNEGNPKHDKHEGDPADWEYHPVLANTLTDQEVLDKIHNFVNTYKGDWNLMFNSCHDFQRKLMREVGLINPSENPGLISSVGYASLSQSRLSLPTPDEYVEYNPPVVNPPVVDPPVPKMGPDGLPCV